MSKPMPVVAVTSLLVEARIAVGPISASLIIAMGLLFYALILGALLSTVGQGAPPDEVREMEREMQHWKM